LWSLCEPCGLGAKQLQKNQVSKMKILLILGCFLSIFACKNELEKQTISDEKMVKIVADLYSVEAILQGANAHEHDSLAPVFQTQVFDFQQVTREEYEKNIRILTQYPAQLDTILTRASRHLNGKN
jgi:hypothetical protein